MTIGGLVLGLALAVTGQVPSLTQCYVCFGILGTAGIACIVIPSTTTDEERLRKAGTAETKVPESRRPAGEVWTLRPALRDTRLWAAFTMTALGVVGYQIMATHQVAHAVDHGFQQTMVVWLFAFGAGCMMAGNLLGGWLFDITGSYWVAFMAACVAVAGSAVAAWFAVRPIVRAADAEQ